MKRGLAVDTSLPGMAVSERPERAGAVPVLNPWLAVPTGLSPETVQRQAHKAHESLALGIRSITGLRSLVRDSWERSLSHHADPAEASPELVYDGGELDEYRRQHPLASIMPVIHQLLVCPAYDSGLLVAVGDEHGRLLWVDGDETMRHKAEGMMFMAGADWSEARVGTSAPGTALALDHGIQISGAEHFNRTVHPWSCTAVPLHDPDSGAVLGVVDITGGSEAVAPHTLSLVEATVAAAQAQLRVERLQSADQSAAVRPAGISRARRPSLPGTDGRGSPAARLYQDSLQVLGRDHGRISIGGSTGDVSTRHAEILTLLAWHPGGLTAEDLSRMLYPRDKSTTTLRAEMVRLRKVLTNLDPAMVTASRPYRLPAPLVVDARQVLNYLQRGSHRMALQIYRGELIPRSDAPAIIELRREISMALRDAVLNDAGPDVLMEYAQLPEAADDVVVWETCLKLLPPRSPKRAAVVAHLERIDAELRA